MPIITGSAITGTSDSSAFTPAAKFAVRVRSGAVLLITALPGESTWLSEGEVCGNTVQGPTQIGGSQIYVTPEFTGQQYKLRPVGGSADADAWEA
jgi:hypothetical protein